MVWMCYAALGTRTTFGWLARLMPGGEESLLASDEESLLASREASSRLFFFFSLGSRKGPMDGWEQDDIPAVLTAAKAC